MELLSHPNYLLKNHLINTKNRALNNYNISNLNYFNKELIKDILKIICLTHDFGKSTTYFQKYIRNEKVEKNKLKNHSNISFILTNYIIKLYMDNIIKNNNSNKNNNFNIKIDKSYYSIFSICVKKHHGNLTNFINCLDLDEEIYYLEKQFKTLDFNFINNLLIENDIITKNINFNFNELIEEVKNLEYFCDDELNYTNNENLKKELYFLYEYLFSLLICADKEDAIFKENVINNMNDNKNNNSNNKNNNSNKNNNTVPKNIINYIKNINSKNEKPINKLRNEIFYSVSNNLDNLDLNHKIYSLNSPTGSGKTLTIFNFVLKLKDKIKKEKNYNMKIIYCLPFLSIIDQNYNVLSNVLNNPPSNILLKHHHLADVDYSYYDNNNNNEIEYLDIDKSLHLIETWQSEIITTTFIQLFYTIFSNKNSNLKKFNKLANSIIILDEIQAIPYKYWDLINNTFKFLANEYNIYFILLTATLPMIFNERECKELLPNKEKYFSKLNRIKMNIHNEKMNIDEFINLLDKDIKENYNKDFLIVLNTINSSKEVYEALKEKNYNNTEYYYLSTNIYPKERLNRIKQINKNEKSKRKIIVSTQLIEAGVDISVDIIYRDFAPLDCINQTAGRCNRHNEQNNKGIVNIVKLINNKNKLYGNYIYGRTILSKTEEVLLNYKTIEEKEFLKLNNKYFKKLSNYKDKSNELLEYIKKFEYGKINKEFKLIENLPTVNLFVNVEKEAEQIYNKFEEIQHIKNIFIRKNEFLKIKKDFYQYVISVPIFHIKDTNILIDENKSINTINEKYYNIETGFNIVNDDIIIL